MKELGIPDFREEEAAESDHRDDAWKHQRDDTARQKRRSEGLIPARELAREPVAVVP